MSNLLNIFYLFILFIYLKVNRKKIDLNYYDQLNPRNVN